MSEIIFRKAEPDDCAWAGERLLETLYDFGVEIFGLGDSNRAIKALGDFFRKSANRFSYKFSYIAQVDGKPAGLLLIFPGSRLQWANFALAIQFFTVYCPGEIIEIIKKAIHMRDEEQSDRDEFYIGNLAVSSIFRRRGVGQKMLEYAQNLAVDKGFNKLALSVECRNTGAIALYEKFGFSIVKEYLRSDQQRNTGEPGSYKMIKVIRNRKN